MEPIPASWLSPELKETSAYECLLLNQTALYG